MSYQWQITTPESQQVDSEKLDRLWDLIQYWKSRAGRRCTATALVVVRHAKLIYERYWGTLGDGIETPVNEHSIFSIYSGNKTVTQVMIGHLIDTGLIEGLDDRLRTYLGPDLGTHPWKDEITLDHLRFHRAGYDGESTSPYPWTWQWGRDHPLRYRPGTRFVYSSVGANTNAEVARRALSGMPPYQEALRKHVLAPLGMDDTRFLFEGDGLSNVVRRVPGNEPEHTVGEGVGVAGGLVDFMDPAGSNMGAGWLCASARDYARFGLMIANGGEGILSKQRLEEIYLPPVNSAIITGLMECQCHVMWDLGLVMAIMFNSCSCMEDSSRPGTWNQNEYRSALLKAVSDIPHFQEQDGRICIEAEHYTLNDADYKWGTGHVWQCVDDESASGGKAMAVLPEDGIGLVHENPFMLYANHTELIYLVHFTHAGDYHLWLRGRGGRRAVTLDIDGQKATTATRVSWPELDHDGWTWSQHRWDGGIATLTIPAPGIYNIQILMYDDGVFVDKIYLTRGTEEPAGMGPEESERRAT